MTYHVSTAYANGATGTFYDVNDFSTFLTTISPVFFFFNKRKIVNCLAIIGILYINHSNDANICTIALLFGVAFNFVFLRHYNVKEKRLLGISFLIISVAIVLMVLANLLGLSDKLLILQVLNTQINNILSAQGSLWMRITIYMDSLSAAMNTCFLGIGPSAFSNYFSIHPSASGLVNPHNSYLEILVEYGAVIALCFVCFTFRMINKYRKRIIRCEDRNERRKQIVLCEMLLIYSIVCISSNSFIGYAWQWVVLCACSVMVGMQGKQYDNVEIESLTCGTGVL